VPNLLCPRCGPRWTTHSIRCQAQYGGLNAPFSTRLDSVVPTALRGARQDSALTAGALVEVLLANAVRGVPLTAFDDLLGYRVVNVARVLRVERSAECR